MAFGILQGRHARLREQLSAYIDDELSPPERFEVEHHLETCLECREELDDLQTIARATSLLPEVSAPRSFILAPSPAVAPPAATRPLEAAAPARSRQIPWFLLGWGAAGVAALLLGAGVAHMLTSIGGSPSTLPAPVRTNAALPPTAAPATPTALATVAPPASATATATPSATPAPTPAPVVAGVPSGGGNAGTAAGPVGNAGGAGTTGGASAAAVAPVGTAGQPGGAAEVTLPPRPGVAPAAAAPVATAPAAVVEPPPTRTTPGQPGGAAVSVGQPAAAAAPVIRPSQPAAAPAPVARPSQPPITGVPPQVIGGSSSGVLVPPPANAPVAGAPVPVRSSPLNPTAPGR